MSKKSLLNESQVRQFMKLAKLEPLSPGFVEGLKEGAGRMRMRDEDDLEEGRGMRRDEDELEEVRSDAAGGGLEDARRGHGRGRGPTDRLEEEEDMEMDVDAAEMEDAAGDDEEVEMDAELEAPVDADVGGKMVAVDDFLSALETALESAMGEEVEIDADDADLDDEPAELEAPVDDAPADVEVDDEMGADDALMEAVTKRVAKRILMEALSAKK
jgi:hypothetical protein